YEDETLGAEFKFEEIPPEHVELAKTWRAKLEESIAETSESLTEKFINGVPVDFEELIGAIRDATIRMKITPVLCGAALRNKGIQRLLDGIRSFLPSPLEVPPPVAQDLSAKQPREEKVLSD